MRDDVPLDVPVEEEASAMDDQALLGIIEQFESESYGFASGDLANRRAYAIERYLAEPYGNEVEGRSAVVDTGFRDTVETAIPQILRVFLAGDEVVEFNPRGPEDEAAAKQETEFVNHVILEKNDAFNVFSTWFRDALMSKVGYVKAYYETRYDILSEPYKGLTDEGLAIVTADPYVQLAQHRSYPAMYQQPPMPAAPAMAQGMSPQSPPVPPMLHDVILRRTKPCGYVKIDNVPPEELKVHRSTRTIGLQESVFVQHSTPKTLSMLRQMGFEVDDFMASESGTDPNNDEIQFARDRFGDEQTFGEDSNSQDPSTREVWVRESYIRVDYDGDGIAELRKVTHVGRKILIHAQTGEPANEETDLIPFAAVTPIIFPHKHVGIGFDDLCDMPSQVATAIQRQFLDNLYLQNNGRYGVDVNRINVDDMLVSRPGGLVRTDGNPAEAIFPFTHPALGEAALRGLEWATNWLQTSTGVTKDAAAISPDILNNATASGVAQMISAQQSRIEAVTRSFASGVKELCGIVHALTLKNATGEEKAKVRGQWVTVDPREWVKRDSMSITVGLGSGTKETRIAALMNLAQAQEKGLQIGICNPANLYHTGTLLTSEMGYKNPDAFWSDPAKNPPPQQPPPPQVQVAQMKMQADQQAAQMKAQTDQQKMQAQMAADQAKAQAQQQIEMAQMQADMAVEKMKAQMTAQMDALRNQLEGQREQDKMRYDMQLEAFKASTAQQTAIVIAHINAASKISAAQVAASASDGSEQLATERAGEA